MGQHFGRTERVISVPQRKVLAWFAIILLGVPASLIIVLAVLVGLCKISLPAP